MSDTISRVMSANKGKNTRPELMVRKALWKNGLRGYRLHWEGAPGRPDITYPGRKIAIFIHGCFWHRCPRCNLPLPKSNIEFWKNKFKRNKERDTKKLEDLEKEGWRTIVVWECEINRDIDNVFERIIKAHGEIE